MRGKIRRAARSRFFVAVAAAIVVAGATAVYALAGHGTSGVASLTGCLDPRGDLGKLAVGDAPLSVCKGNAVQVHLSGGDITAVTPTPGGGLTGGGENGAVTLGVSGEVARNNVFFTGDSTFTVPPGVSAIVVEVRGGGGGSGTVKGGGQGGFIRALVPVAAGNTLVIDVGNGGAANTGTSGDGETGETSVVSDSSTSLVIAYGGGGGRLDGVGSGGNGEVRVPAVGIERVDGLGGGTPDFYGSGGESGPGGQGFHGQPGYVLLHLIR